MADGYVDHGAYASNLGATPTWGVPQEGDGSAMAPSGTASIASVVFASVPSSGTLSICGVGPSMSGVAGAANVDAAANALATNINATTQTVGSAVAYGQPRLQNLVFARGPSGGAPSGTCQIMMRVGSTTLNHAVNSNVAITHTFNVAPTVTQFEGGVGGCYGWLINDAALGVSSFHAVGAYGVMVANPYVRTFTPAETDFIYARTASGKLITMPVGSNLIRGNLGWPLNLVFDTNTKWTGDSGTGVVEIRLKANSSNFVHLRPDNSGNSSNAVTYSCLTPGNLTISFSANSSACTCALFDSMVGCFTARGVKFTEYEAPSATGNIRLVKSNQNNITFIGCEFDFSTFTRQSLQYGPGITFSNGNSGALRIIGGSFKTNLVGVPADGSGLIAPTSSSVIGHNFELLLDGIQFTTNSSYSIKLFTATGNSADYSMNMVVRNCTGLSLDGAALGLQTAAVYNRPSRMNNLLFVGEGYQRFETRNGIAEWNPNASPAYPTLGATMPDGTVYSIRMYWLSTGANRTFEPMSYISSRLNRLADGVREVTQEIAFDTSRGIDGRHIGARLSYTDSSGIPRMQDTWGTDPVVSAAPWTGLGSWANFAARKFTWTTTHAVKQNTMVNVEFYCIGVPPGSGNTDVFIDPEPSIV